jgi:hypothetical protein
MTWLQIILLGIAVYVVFLLSLRWYMHRAHRKVQEEWELRYPGLTLVRKGPANFFGLSSKGMAQIRGNGFLFLTGKKLVFRMLVPNRWIEIDLVTVEKVENPRSFLGKTKGRKLLAVYFRDEMGSKDSAAWMVGDLEKWTEAVRGIGKS